MNFSPQYIVSQMTNYVIFDTVPDGATTLHFAACENIKIKSVFMKYIVCVCIFNCSVLCISATGQVDTAKWLIDSDVGGKLITSKDNNGDTPAHDAADNGSVYYNEQF